MRKNILSIIAVMTMITLTVRSVYAEQTIELGVKAGLNIAMITGNNTDGFVTRNGFIGGGFFSMGFTENFGARLEALYVQKGAEISLDKSETLQNGNVLTTAVYGNNEIDYIEIPVLAVGRFPATETLTISAFAGPTIGLLISAESEFEKVEKETYPDGGSLTTITTGGGDIKDDIKSMDIGVTTGVSATFVVSSVTLTLEGRTTIGLRNFNEDLEDNPATPSIDESTMAVGSNKNIAVGFLVGIAIPFGGE
jgi:hypothetical protein